ncbi:MAG: ScpA family protein [Actinomycetota bacterium]
MSPEFAVELPVFQGPFRALAELILDHKVDVCDVSVSAVTDRFLARAKDVGEWNLEEATWFLAICAVLLELKVGRLMPKPEELRDEDLLSGSPDLAYARSLELAAFRRMAVEVRRMLEESARFVNRGAAPPEEFAHLYPDVMENVTPEMLVRTAAAALRPPPAVDLSHVAPIRASVSEAIRHVEARLGETGTAWFRDLVADCQDRIHVVVRFLALLELHREGKVELEQADTFGEIQVRWQGLPTANVPLEDEGGVDAGT